MTWTTEQGGMQGDLTIRLSNNQYKVQKIKMISMKTTKKSHKMV